MQPVPANGRSAGGTDTESFGKPPEDLPRWAPGPVAPEHAALVEVIDLGKAADRRRFLDAADAAQSSDPNYIAGLRMERMKFLDVPHNPALSALDVCAMVAMRGGKPIGRISAHIDRAYNDYHHVKTGWFGFFDCVDEQGVADALLDRAVRWVKERGMTQIIGPNNFTTNHQTGMLVENFARPAFVEQTYNPSYYEKLVTAYGFGKAKDLLAFWVDVSAGIEDPKVRRFHDVSLKAQKRYGLTIRSARMKDFESEVAILFRLYNESWQRNWGFVPVQEAEFKNIARDLKPIVVDELVLIVEDREGKPVAFSVTLPNINEIMPKNGRLFPFGWWRLLTGMKRIKTARVFVLGVIPAYRRRGVEAMLCIETALRGKRLGYTAGEIGWTLEDNVLINRAIESFGARLDRRYRLFGLEL